MRYPRILERPIALFLCGRLIALRRMHVSHSQSSISPSKTNPTTCSFLAVARSRLLFVCAYLRCAVNRSSFDCRFLFLLFVTTPSSSIVTTPPPPRSTTPGGSVSRLPLVPTLITLDGSVSRLSVLTSTDCLFLGVLLLSLNSRRRLRCPHLAVPEEADS
jgi:hypothetical protein